MSRFIALHELGWYYLSWLKDNQPRAVKLALKGNIEKMRKIPSKSPNRIVFRKIILYNSSCHVR